MRRARLPMLTIAVALLLSACTGNAQQPTGNWETAVFLDNNEVITRVSIDKDNETAILLSDFAAVAGYTATQTNNRAELQLRGNGQTISVGVGKDTCEKNGETLQLEKPVFADGEDVYLPQSFLRDALHIDTVLIDQEAPQRRVNGLYLADRSKLENDFIVVGSERFAVETAPTGSGSEAETALLRFSLGIEKESIAISMNYEGYLISNENAVADAVKELLEGSDWQSWSRPEDMADFRESAVITINETIGMQFVKCIYITDFTRKHTAE